MTTGDDGRGGGTPEPGPGPEATDHPGPRFAVVPLGPADIDAIMELEAVAFDPSIQASRSKILKRFALGHQMLGAKHEGRLVGAISFSAVRFSTDALHQLPKTFDAYSTQPVPPDADTLCLYSIGVEQSARGLACTPPLIRAAIDAGKAQGLTSGIADGPLPSFNGNAQVRPKLEIRQLIDGYLETGAMPPGAEFLHDPIIAFYTRLTGCRVLALLADFIPEDVASGGWRALLYLDF